MAKPGYACNIPVSLALTPQHAFGPCKPCVNGRAYSPVCGLRQGCRSKLEQCKICYAPYGELVDVAQSETLAAAFGEFGSVQSVRLIRGKGGEPYVVEWRFWCSLTQLLSRNAVAYISFDKASSAAQALEALHRAVLNSGKGPSLKVFFAEPRGSRYSAALVSLVDLQMFNRLWACRRLKQFQLPACVFFCVPLGP